MTTLTLDYNPMCWSSTSSIGQMFNSFTIPAFASVFVKDAQNVSLTLEEQLDGALHIAQTIVRKRLFRCGIEASSRMQARLSELMNYDNWDEDDAMPTRQSMETLFDAVSQVNVPFTSLSIATGGALKATWIDGGRTITAVGRDNKQISWSKVEETADGFNTEANEGPILEFLGTFGH